MVKIFLISYPIEIIKDLEKLIKNKKIKGSSVHPSVE